MRFAVDTGGTFTDLVLDMGDELRMFKVPTTPEDPVQGVLDVVGLAAGALGLRRDELLGRGEHFIHGTTRAINALLTGATARTAFMTTHGHPDILLFRQGGRADPFDFSRPFPEPFVPRSLTIEVPERIACDGSVVAELDEDAVVSAISELHSSGVEAVGVALLWSIVNPVHELRVGALLEEHLPGVPYSLSHRLNPTLREYRRASATCIDAALKPLMSDYLASLAQRLSDAGFGGRLLVVTSQGAMLDAADVAQAPIHSIKSGPAMAPVAGRFYAQAVVEDTTAIVVDTGGTTCDVSVIRNGEIPHTRESWIGPEYQGHMTGFPSVDVTSVGAGGGSIAHVDDAGLLHVGPRSAGSVPGPACYARGGTAATVTDACVVMGYLDSAHFLGGAMTLDVDSARAAIERTVAAPLELTVEEAASAIVRVTTENMVHAIEEITVNQGIDPRQAVLIGGGGAAGLNLVAIGARLGARLMLIPEIGAALSAAGGLLSDLSTEHAQTFVTTTDRFDYAGANRTLDDLSSACRAFAARCFPGLPYTIEYAIEARYPKQIWEIQVPIVNDRFVASDDVERLADGFHRAHEALFAIAERDSRIEVIGWRARVSARSGDRPVPRMASAGQNGGDVHQRSIYFADRGWIAAAVVDVESLPEGAACVGPAVLESPFTTVIVPPGARAHKTDLGTLVLTMELD